MLLTALPVAATAQQPKSVPRVGLLNYGSCAGPDAFAPAFLKGLTDLGYVIGTNVTVECRSADGSYSGLSSAAAELVHLKVDVIVALNHPAARAAKEATSRIPIVMVASGDPVGSGFVASLARPGGNVTGLTYYATELTAKRLELLKEMVPNLSRIAVLDNPDLSYLPFLGDTKTAGQALGLRLQGLQVRTPADIDRAFATAGQQGAQAVFVLPDPAPLFARR